MNRLRPHAAACLRACLLLMLAAAPAAAQDLVELLRQQRLKARTAEVMDLVGPRVEPIPIAAMPARGDSVQAHVEALLMAQAQSETITGEEPPRQMYLRWRKVEPGQQGLFLNRFREAFWTAEGTRIPSVLDSIATHELRGRLGTLFGIPTRNSTARETYGYAASEYVQFEYWFVVNDTMPFMVIDPDGPFSTGLIFAGDEAHLAALPHLAWDMITRVSEQTRSTTYLDYYQSREDNKWYQVGYDGSEFFVRETRPPRWADRPPIRPEWIIFR